MTVASRRKARLLAARRRLSPFGLAGGAERPLFDGSYRVAPLGNGYSGNGFWQWFDRFPRKWRDAINYAPNGATLIELYRACCAKLYERETSAQGS